MVAGEYSAGNRCGYGVCRYYNGDFYEGTWADGVRNGIGMQQCTDGSNYVGQYKEAKREGYGVYTFHNGDCYLGTYKQDLPNGLGVYLFEKGQKYMGEWESGKKHGLCVFATPPVEHVVGFVGCCCVFSYDGDRGVAHGAAQHAVVANQLDYSMYASTRAIVCCCHPHEHVALKVWSCMQM
ncbi:MAG: hypothetical protein HC767_03870 [Akkermansiaceae bacterium]|nr:hypothetical protein [Akkermansiaceae bacterium]